MSTIAVIGAGFSGTLLSLHLLRRCPPGTRVRLIERNRQFGRGQAYATGNPSHLLNVPAGRMSAFRDRPHDFLDWLQKQPVREGGGPVEAGHFIPRREFGAYVRYLLNEELKRPDLGETLELVGGDVLGIGQAGRRLSLQLDRERTVEADSAVLAVGNVPPEPPKVRDGGFYDGPLYRPDPWAADALSDLDPQAPVLLIGTGLTMVDVAVSLLDQGHRGPIHALSRRGLLPLRHVAGVAQPPGEPRALPASVGGLTRLLRHEAARAMRAGGDWRPVIDGVRPFTTDVWQAMPLADRARFLRHMRPWWDIHRHRMPGPTAHRINDACERAQLTVRAGRIQGYVPDMQGVRVVYRPRFQDAPASIRAARVVNCSGPGTDYDRIAHPLVRSMLRQGMVRPDPLRLGLDVTGNCALLDGEGAVSRRLFAVGPVTKGAFWEMTAVPDIRRQCEFLAGHLASLAAPAVQAASAGSSGAPCMIGRGEIGRGE